jgi:colanic acid/amylovoran biosynthesis glycosyltransferase
MGTYTAITKHMKIAIFSGAIPSTTFIEHLIDGVSKQHQVLLFGVIETPTQYPSKNIKIYRTPYSHLANLGLSFYRTGLLLFKRPKALFVLLKEVKRYQKLYERWIWYSKFLPIVLYKPDVFHMQWARDLEFYTFLKTEFHMSLIVSLRGAHINYTPIVNPYVAAIYKNTFPKIDAFHAVSKAIGLEAQKYGAPSEKISVIHSPIPKLFFNAFNTVRKGNPKHLKLMSVGRFHWKKGFTYALDAISGLLKRGYDIHYTIIGPSFFTEELVFKIHQLQLTNHIVLKKAMTQDALIEEMKTHDMLLLPSVEEGIANVVLEAMAMGIPVISTDCGGMSEVVIPDETGWLVPVRDADAFANAIVDVSQTSDIELQRITQNAHDYVKKHFKAEDSIEQFLEMYAEFK